MGFDTDKLHMDYIDKLRRNKEQQETIDQLRKEIENLSEHIWRK